MRVLEFGAGERRARELQQIIHRCIVDRERFVFLPALAYFRAFQSPPEREEKVRGKSDQQARKEICKCLQGETRAMSRDDMYPY